MRSIIIAVGLCLSAIPASAGNNIALANGCVYAPSAQSNTWFLIYRQSGSKGHCALTVKTQAKHATAPQPQMASRAKLRRTNTSGFAMGALR